VSTDLAKLEVVAPGGTTLPPELRCGIVSAEANTAIPPEGDFERMARRRYQQGQLLQKGKKKKVWVGRWREDTIRPDGTRYRQRRSEILGTLKDYPTRRLAGRALEQRISEANVNSLDYQPRPTATFREFVMKWERTFYRNLNRQPNRPTKSRLKKHLIPDFGETSMKNLSAQRLQAFIAQKARSIGPKSVKNVIALLRMMWNQAKALGYVNHDPFGSLVLPELNPLNERAFSLQEMKSIIGAAQEPFKTLYWISADLGDRGGEAWASLMLEPQWDTHTQSVKTVAASRRTSGSS
jgi:hypothetical protein